MQVGEDARENRFTPGSRDPEWHLAAPAVKAPELQQQKGKGTGPK